MPNIHPGVFNNRSGVYDTRPCVSNTRSCVSNTRSGASNSRSSVSKTHPFVSKTRAGVSNARLGVANTHPGVLGTRTHMSTATRPPAPPHPRGAEASMSLTRRAYLSRGVGLPHTAEGSLIHPGTSIFSENLHENYPTNASGCDLCVVIFFARCLKEKYLFPENAAPLAQQSSGSETKACPVVSTWLVQDDIDETRERAELARQS